MMKIWLVVLCGLLLSPVVYLFTSFFSIDGAQWSHITQYLLTQYITNTIMVGGGVGLLSVAIGVTAAWLISHYEFPAKKTLRWLLVLPLAIPTYVAAFVYDGFFSYQGIGITITRTLFNTSVNVGNIYGAVVIVSLVLYPYVYVLALHAFEQQLPAITRACRSLGSSYIHAFFRVGLPFARPYIALGASLIVMETLAEYGAMDYLGIQTIAVGVIRTWYGLGDINTASQLAALLVIIVMVVVLWEHHTRNPATLSYTKQQCFANAKTPRDNPVACRSSLLYTVVGRFHFASSAVACLEFGYSATYFLELSRLAFATIGLSSAAGLLIVAIALPLAYALRNPKITSFHWIIRLTAYGYAIPSVVIALAILHPIGYIDNQINSIVDYLFDRDIGLVFSGTILILLFAYTIRFLRVALNTQDNGLQRISPSIDHSARLLHTNTISLFGRIHLPILKPSLLAALLLVWIDVVKELPATLVLRPIQFNTLAIFAFEHAKEEAYSLAAPPSLAIILLSIVAGGVLLSQSRQSIFKPAYAP